MMEERQVNSPKRVLKFYPNLPMICDRGWEERCLTDPAPGGLRPPPRDPWLVEGSRDEGLVESVVAES